MTVGRPNVSKTSELDIQHAILEQMRNGRVWSNADLKRSLTKLLQLTDADVKVGERKNEELWENRVNNALSPSRASSLYGKGFVENCGHGLHRITEAGRRYINEDFDLDDLLNAI